MHYKFLLIGNLEESPSFHNLFNALTALGELQIFPQAEAMQEVPRQEYDMIIVDVTALDNEMLLVSRIRAQQLKARILVLTSSPTWRRAKEALQAGAMNYLDKSLSEREYRAVFVDILARDPPPWP